MGCRHVTRQVAGGSIELIDPVVEGGGSFGLGAGICT